MQIGEEIIVGRMGRQPMRIADASVSPQHARLRRTGERTYQIEALDAAQKIVVFGMRIKRKTVHEATPILLGTFKTSVQQLLQDASAVDLAAVWAAYEKEKRQWDRKAMLVNYLRVVPSILMMLLGMFVGQDLDNGTRMGITAGMTVGVLIVSMVASDRILARKNLKIAELNAKLQSDYVCPHCHRPLPPTPYKILKQNRYCPRPDCNYPLP
ncbi:MAG: FHA domain-containing protein [Alloprevotella sp.]